MAGKKPKYEELAARVIELEKSEAAYKRDEQFLLLAYQIIKNSPAVAFLWQNKEGWPVEFVSENVTQLFGYSVHDFKSGKASYAEIIHPDDQERVVSEVTSYSSKKTRKNFYHQPYRIVTKSGKVKWIDDRTFIRRDENGEITHYQGIVLDITKRRKTEENLHRQHSFLSRIMETSPSGIINIDCEGKITFANQRAKEILGHKNNNIIGSSYNNLGANFMDFSGNPIPDDELPYRVVMLTGRPVYGLNHAIVKPDGNKLLLAINAVPQFDNSGKLIGILATVDNITGQMEMTERLRASEEQFRELYDNAPVGYHELDKEGRIKHINRTETELLGYTGDEMIGRYVWEFMAPGQQKISQSAYQHKISLKKVPQSGFEREYNRKDGTKIYVFIEDKLLLDKSGEVIGIRSTLQDISERKKMEELLLQSEKMASIGILAAGIAHEINNPVGFIQSNLNTLLSYCKKLEDYFHDADEILKAGGKKRSDDSGILAEKLTSLGQQRKLEYILENLRDAISESLEGTGRIEKIVSNLKSFARTEKAELESADINEILEKSLNLVWNELKYKAEVIREFSSLPQVKCVSQHLSQVFVNILLNAGQAIEKQGIIRIKTFQAGNFIKVQISDTGQGIPKDNLSKIYDAFFTTKDPGKGTGLGLSISFKIIQEHNGAIDVESEEGAGTTFLISLPCTESILLRRLKVLIVDDDTGAREVLQQMVLEINPNWSVQTAADGFEAGDMLNTFNPDLILLDVNMPGISGYELCRKIKVDARHKGKKIVVMSGTVMDDLGKSALAAGADAYLHKPVFLETILQTINELFRSD